MELYECGVCFSYVVRLRWYKWEAKSTNVRKYKTVLVVETKLGLVVERVQDVRVAPMISEHNAPMTLEEKKHDVACSHGSVFTSKGRPRYLSLPSMKSIESCSE